MAESIRLEDLPFELDVALGADAASLTLDIALVASADDDIDAESLLPAAEMIDLLPHAVNLQLLGALASGRASLQVTTRHVSTDHRHWNWRLSAWNLPQAHLGLLVGLIVQTAYADAPIARLSLRSGTHISPARSAQWLVEQAAQGLPALHRAWPFEVTRGEPARQQRRITVTFESALDAGSTARFEEVVNVWDHLVTFGGFQLDFAEQDGIDPAMGSFQYPEPCVVEHLIWCDGDDDAADGSLLNLLALLHADGDRIERVLLE